MGVLGIKTVSPVPLPVNMVHSIKKFFKVTTLSLVPLHSFFPSLIQWYIAPRRHKCFELLPIPLLLCWHDAKDYSAIGIQRSQDDCLITRSQFNTSDSHQVDWYSSSWIREFRSFSSKPKCPFQRSPFETTETGIW